MMVRWTFILEELSGRGGVETVLGAVISEIRRRHQDVALYLPLPTQDEEWNASMADIALYYDPIVLNANMQVVLPQWRRILGLRRLLALHGTGDVLVATHVPQTAMYARLAVGYRDAPPIVSWLHNPTKNFFNPEYINYADLHWSISHGIGREVLERLNPARMVCWIGNPIDIPADSIASSEQPKFIFVGRLENRQKRVDVILKALSEVSFSYHLHVFGDGPDRQALQRFAIELGICERVTWHGWKADPWDEVREASCLLLSSDFEGFPMVIGEALSRRLPVIASNCEFGPGELVRPNLNGMLFSPSNWQELRDILNGAVLNDRFRDWSMATREGLAQYNVQAVVDRMAKSLEYRLSQEVLGSRHEH